MRFGEENRVERREEKRNQEESLDLVKKMTRMGRERERDGIEEEGEEMKRE
jgi:hypothetical protein